MAKVRIVALAALMTGPAAVAAPLSGAGPFNAEFLEGGIGITRTLPAASPHVAAGAAYSVSTWVNPRRIQPGLVSLIEVGAATACRCLGLVNGRPVLMDGTTRLTARNALRPGRWSHVAATADGRFARLFVDGVEVARAAGVSVAVSPALGIAPPAITGAAATGHFGGALVGAELAGEALAATDIAARAARPPAFGLVPMTAVGIGWEWQKKANTGLWQPQDAWTLPKGRGDTTPPVAKPIADVPALQPLSPRRWQINRWSLIEAAKAGTGTDLSRPGVALAGWYPATVPGTVLTTLVDRGVYPDPYYGLNNLAIPEKLARQDYWYRTSFRVPGEAVGRRLALHFKGINYAAEIWANGARLGTTTGAFVRGDFALAPVAGENVIAVRVAPPPHPGTPHEQSISAGVGENGGQLAIDGPTFVATEGWDWIPAIRDRNTGLWQAVELRATGDIRILDPRIITDLPLPRTDTADIHIEIPVRNDGAAQATTISARFGTVSVAQTRTLPPGVTTIVFTPAAFPQLRLRNPELWWPNGYGAPALQTLQIDAGTSDSKTVRFGIREVSYELSLFDSRGILRRVDVHTTDGALRGERLIDVRHEAIKNTPGGWVESLTAAGETSPAVRDVPATYALPHLALRVNGVRIAARGGNWGMDDAMKRVDRARLEPYFRLEREANMNIIRNWMGTNTEDVFYDLADENGLMIVNDFWASTQDFQVEPQDPQLFLANARDVISRYRNHPSIVAWFGRNEGVPYPLLNTGLDDLVAELDGTRWFTGSSNSVNLQGSGPYNYRPPEGYFTDLASGFSVETGTPSLSSLEAIEASVPAADRWPLSDTLAYHDWHFAGNGDTRSFMAALETMFGAGTSLADFERKAQMMNLETHQAIYEGFLGHLWTKNSGRLLWMSHPSWPSNAWQLYSADYDTHAAFYGAKKAAESLHIQLNRPDNSLVVINTTRAARPRLTASIRILGLDNRELWRRSRRLDAAANAVTPGFAVPLTEILAREGMALVTLTLTDARGAPVSENFYWRGKDLAAHRALAAMPAQPLDVAAIAGSTGGENIVTIILANPGPTAALAAKLTLLDAAGARVLPAYYSDNYITLLPGAKRTLVVRYLGPAIGAKVALRGWNVPAATVVIAK